MALRVPLADADKAVKLVVRGCSAEVAKFQDKERRRRESSSFASRARCLYGAGRYELHGTVLVACRSPRRTIVGKSLS